MYLIVLSYIFNSPKDYTHVHTRTRTIYKYYKQLFSIISVVLMDIKVNTALYSLEKYNKQIYALSYESKTT